MKILRLMVNNYRVIDSVDVELSPTLNLVCGDNGSGKTSLLESIYSIAHVRPFGGGSVVSCVREGCDAFSVFGEFEGFHDERLTAGVMRSKQGVEARLNGVTVSALSQITLRLPMLAMSPDGFFQFRSSARVRRASLDWGLFHVEHEYQSVLSRYRRALKQRNSLLKQRAEDQLAVWDKRVVADALAIDSWRANYCRHWEDALQALLPDFGLLKDVKIRYRRGWAENRELIDVLIDQRSRDLASGYTRNGPHSADFSVLVEGRDAGEYYSAGQLKVLHIALRLAQVELQYKSSGRASIIIIDDLLSELDCVNASTVIELLSASRHQLFVSSVAWDQGLFHDSDWRVFHVERGGLLA